MNNNNNNNYNNNNMIKNNNSFRTVTWTALVYREQKDITLSLFRVYLERIVFREADKRNSKQKLMD